jgi:hypothetical protein
VLGGAISGHAGKDHRYRGIGRAACFMDRNLGCATPYASTVGASRVDSGLARTALRDRAWNSCRSNFIEVVVFRSGRWFLEL